MNGTAVLGYFFMAISLLLLAWKGAGLAKREKYTKEARVVTAFWGFQWLYCAGYVLIRFYNQEMNSSQYQIMSELALPMIIILPLFFQVGLAVLGRIDGSLE